MPIAACVRDRIDAKLFEAVDVDMFVYQIVMFCHAWALKARHFASTMDVETYVKRGLKLMLRSVLTEQGRGQMQRLDAERVTPAMQATHPRRQQAASR
jgi:TetR/AcrR family transcriptional regulator, cholesterol catabolism regulator